MKTELIKSIVVILGVLLSLNAHAYDAYINGIYYNLNSSSSTATVTYGASYKSAEYTGNISIPSSISYYDGRVYSVTSIGEYAFNDCLGLTSITIPNSVTSIGSMAFANCWGLTSITIPSSITKIGNHAFLRNGKYTIVMEGKTPPRIESNTFNESFATIKVPQKSRSTYKSASNWMFLTIMGVPDAYIDGFYYNLDESTMTAEVAYKDENYNTYSGAVKVPASFVYNGDTYTVTSIGASAFRNCVDLLSVRLTDNITSINEYAFYNCNNLLYLSMPKNLMSIGNSSLYNCKSLPTITLPAGITTIGQYALSGCSGLTDLTIPPSVSSIGKNAFNGCTGTLNLNCSVAGVGSSSDDPFYGNQFTSVNIGATAISVGAYVLYNLPLVTSLNIVNGVQSLGGSNFYICPKLTSVLLPNSVNAMGKRLLYNFTGKLIVECSIPSGTNNTDSPFYNSKLTSFEAKDGAQSVGLGAFYGCTNLEEVKLANSITNIEASAFRDCSKLSSITMSQVQKIGYNAFYNCTALTSIDLPSSLTEIGESAFQSSGLTSITVPSHVITIGSSAFRGLSALTNISIPNSVTSLGESVLYGSKGNLVVNCSNISQNTFANTNLTSATIGEDVVSVGDNAFQGSTDLETLDIKSRKLVSIGESAFNNCSKLTKVSIPDISTWCGISFASSDGNPLYYAKKLYVGNQLVTDLVLPAGLEELKKYAFYHCESLKSVKIPQSVRSIQSDAFNGCTNLESVNMDNMEAWCNISFGNTFSNPVYYAKSLSCNGEVISDLIVPESITAIKPYAYYNCETLKSLTLHDKVSDIGEYAFYGCSNLSNVYNKRTTPQTITNNQFSYYGNLHVVKGSKGVFAAATNWKSFTITDDVAPTLVTSIALDRELYLGEEGDIASPIATVSPANASYQTLTWSSSDPSICNVNASTGRIVFLNAGEATLTVKATDGSGVTKTAKMRVGEYTIATGISLNQNSASLMVGESISLVASVSPGNATDKSVVWSTSDSKVATVEDGLVTAQGVGSVVITAKTNDGSNLSATCTISVEKAAWDITDGSLDVYSVETSSQYEKIIYTRTFNDTEWQTLFVPFALSHDDWKKDFEVARIGALYEYDTNEDGRTDQLVLNVIPVTGGSLRPNYPYLIKAKTTGEKTITLTNATLYATEEKSLECATPETALCLKGTYTKKNGLAGCYLMNGGVLNLETSNTTTLDPFRWYLQAENKDDASLPLPAEIRIQIAGEGGQGNGDINGDGYVNISDVTTLVNIILGK